MNLDKSDVKIGTVLEIGTRLEDMLEAVGKDMHRLEGSVTALRAAAVSLEGLNKHADQDVDGGHMDLETAKHVKKYVARAHQIALNMAQNAENNRWIQQGKVQGMDMAVQAAKKFRDDEVAKAQALRAAIAQGAVKAQSGELVHTGEGERPVSVRPTGTLKEQRLAEELALEAQEKAQANMEQVSADALAEVAASKSKGKKKNGPNTRQKPR